MLAGYGIGISVLYSWYEAIRAVGHARWYLAFEVAHLALLVAGLLAFTRLGVVAAAAVQLVAAWLLVPVVWRSLRAAGIAPPVVALRRAVVGCGAPTAACLAVAELLRRTGVSGVGADASLAAAAWELTVLVTCFVLVAVPANLGILRELWHLRPKTTA
jgi:PST family polysaccharide transporter